MRLLNTRTLELEEFISDQDSLPRYAILSHTWGEGEVIFADMKSLQTPSQTKAAGFEKLRETCRIALEHDLGYCWIDTCCIDKSSSAELSEAINSMFNWYRWSKLCIVYFVDLFVSDLASDNQLPALRGCHWFTRGWTLQELIAPFSIEFFNATWSSVGSKSSLQECLETITGIPKAVFQNPDELETIPVACRMSWAAHRHTTRPEDQAYCLMGLFDVNMPMLYGEGNKAFLRLQEEIIRTSNDLSIFAWTSGTPSGFLAPHPRAFAGCRGLIQRMSDTPVDRELSITNNGIRIMRKLQQISEGRVVLVLGVRFSRDPSEIDRGIVVEKIAPDVFIRPRNTELVATHLVDRVEGGPVRPIYLLRKVTRAHDHYFVGLWERTIQFQLSGELMEHHRVRVVEGLPRSCWNLSETAPKVLIPASHRDSLAWAAIVLQCASGEELERGSPSTKRVAVVARYDPQPGRMVYCTSWVVPWEAIEALEDVQLESSAPTTRTQSSTTTLRDTLEKFGRGEHYLLDESGRRYAVRASVCAKTDSSQWHGDRVRPMIVISSQEGLGNFLELERTT